MFTNRNKRKRTHKDLEVSQFLPIGIMSQAVIPKWFGAKRLASSIRGDLFLGHLLGGSRGILDRSLLLDQLQSPSCPFCAHQYMHFLGNIGEKNVRTRFIPKVRLCRLFCTVVA